MSEYQYYEFQAVDRPLTDGEMRELRAVSSRAEITPTRFVNFYTWGDFKGNPSAWMERYFDAFLYLANWGTHELMLRLPRHLLVVSTAERYCLGESASARGKGDYTVLEFLSETEYPEDVDDGSGWLSSLISLRAELASGDHRALYLAWLLCVQNGEVDEDEPEPPLPPGLGQLTAGQRAFSDFLRIDRDLVAAAAERSPPAEKAPPRKELIRWIASLPGAEKDRLLARIAAGEESHPRAALLRRFRESSDAAERKMGEPRTAAMLLDAAERRAEARRREEAERAARERARRERAEAEALERRLDELAMREEAAWRRIEELVAERKPASYDEAVRLLRDLRALGSREGRIAEADARIEALREQHARKSTFIDRLERAGLAGLRSST
jgi:hypothetical protein